MLKCVQNRKTPPCMDKRQVCSVSQTINVQMLGSFSLQYGARRIDDQSNRMKKVWLLLAYIIFSRASQPTQAHYLDLLQGMSSDESVNPNGRIKAMFYRVRTLLNELDDRAGHEWIIRKNGTYAWNGETPVTLDVEEFERLCGEAHDLTEEEAKLSLYRQALALYRGDFLPKLAMEPWVMPIAAYYHQMYLNAVEETLTLLEQKQRWEELVSLCKNALKIEPYSEPLYQHLMRGYIALKDRPSALNAYDELSKLLFSNFAVMPSDESRALYREASREEGTHTVPAGTVRELLKEPAAAKGAVYCEYDFFKLLYQVQARAILRSGDVIHIALFSVQGYRGKELARRSLDLAMNNLQELIVSNLRQGDVVTRCSISQLLVMLPQANYENSCAVCQRLLKAFNRQYPHSPADIQYSVQPLDPLGAAPHGDR